MDLFRVEFLSYGLMVGCGVGLLRHGPLLVEKIGCAKKAEHDNSIILATMSILTLALATALLLYPALVFISNHKAFLQSLILGGAVAGGSVTQGAGAVAPLVGLLGILMALVTAGVVNLARKAVDDVRDARKDFDQQGKEHSERIGRHRADMQSRYSTLVLLQQRLLLLHINRLEVEALTANGETAGEHWTLRSVLGTLYARPSPMPLMEYLDRFYDRERAGALLDEERSYIRAIAAHWDEHGGEIGDKGELIALAERVLNKL